MFVISMDSKTWTHPEHLKISALIELLDEFSYKPDRLIIPCMNLSLEQGNVYGKHTLTAYQTGAAL